MNNIEDRKEVAIANLCRSYLYIKGFLTEKEMKNVHNKIMKYRDKHKVSISYAQLCSADFIYDDNARE